MDRRQKYETRDRRHRDDTEIETGETMRQKQNKGKKGGE